LPSSRLESIRKHAKYEGKPISRGANARSSQEKAGCSGQDIFERADISFIMGLQDFLELFTSYSHHCPFRPASGLRLEIASHLDKKKPEFYFSSAIKKILTEKTKRHCPRRQKSLNSTKVDRTPANTHFFCLENGKTCPKAPRDKRRG
jgi:hypothetical protein